MASKSFSKVLSPLARQLASPAVQRRTFVAAAAGAARATVVKAARPIVARQQVRGVKTIDFAGVKEDVYGKS
jgi:ketol-acid reductoisomerase